MRKLEWAIVIVTSALLLIWALTGAIGVMLWEFVLSCLGREL